MSGGTIVTVLMGFLSPSAAVGIAVSPSVLLATSSAKSIDPLRTFLTSVLEFNAHECPCCNLFQKVPAAYAITTICCTIAPPCSHEPSFMSVIWVVDNVPVYEQANRIPATSAAEVPSSLSRLQPDTSSGVAQ
ncbi:hypothetical protein BU15DRAFT_68765 [Melanogaster broomeanus]|nr:hypothetical protein BU15DRAFT_68765 [Melanogaster broomeanus]